jgi:hypothetical protein
MQEKLFSVSYDSKTECWVVETGSASYHLNNRTYEQAIQFGDSITKRSEEQPND